MEAKKFKTLQEVKNDYILFVYENLDYCKLRTAEALGISIRTMRNICNKLTETGWVDPGKFERRERVRLKTENEKKDPFYYPFPTNEERLKHLDEMSNRNYL